VHPHLVGDVQRRLEAQAQIGRAEAMGAAAKERVAAWTVESEWPNWLNVYKELAR